MEAYANTTQINLTAADAAQADLATPSRALQSVAVPQREHNDPYWASEVASSISVDCETLQEQPLLSSVLGSP